MRVASVLLLVGVLAGLIAGGQTTGRYSGPWELEVSESDAGLRGVHAAGPGVVWASGTGGTVLRSEDSGYEWQPCTLPPEAARLDFRAVWGWNAQSALAMSSGPGDLSRLYQTTDGCSSWQLVAGNPDAGNANNPGFWDGLLFLDARNGYIYGDPVESGARIPNRGKALLVIPLEKSSDGGKTWKPAKGLSALPGESSFAASNSAMAAVGVHIWLGTSKARVLRSSDGLAWQSAQTPLASGNDSSGVFSLAFRDQKHGVAAGGDYRKPQETHGTAAYTADGGKHWTAASKPPHGFRSAVAWDSKDKAWIVAGTNGSDISYDDGKSWQFLDSGNWNALSLPWAVGPHGQIGKLGTLPGTRAAGVREPR
jgi:photosystem II stability/assembly factor-like uncharacterized protein